MEQKVNLQRPNSYSDSLLGNGRALPVDHDPQQIGMPKMEFVGGHPDEYCIFLKNLTETELSQITSLDGAPLDVKEERNDIE